MSKGEIKTALMACKTEEEWSAKCDDVKAAVKNGVFGDAVSGDYPDWWFQEVVMSGLLAEASAAWTE